MEYITRVMRCWHGPFSDAVAGKSSAFLGGSHGMGREGKGLEKKRETLFLAHVTLSCALASVWLSGARARASTQFLVGLWDADFPGGTHPVLS